MRATLLSAREGLWLPSAVDREPSRARGTSPAREVAERNSPIFRIQFDPFPGGLCCRLAGRLDAECAEEARRALAGRAGVRRAELGELGAVDEAGLALLADLRSAGIELVDLSPYLELRLERRDGGRAPSSARASAADGEAGR